MKWSKWRPFPDPRAQGVLVAPFGPGSYELRHGTLLLFPGHGFNVAKRMTSILPRPHGAGRRNNKAKREYALRHLPEVEYRTCACDSNAAAIALESALLANHDYLLEPRRRRSAT